MSKITASLCLVCLMLTVLWLGLLITDMATAGPLETFEQVAAHASRLHGLFYATYLNAALLTVAAVALFAALHAWLKPTAPGWIAVGQAFVPIYGALNLFAYLSQVTLRADPRHANTAELMLRLTLQAWPASAMAFLNGLAYAILGIPIHTVRCAAAGAERRGLHPGRDWLLDRQRAACPGCDDRRGVVSCGLVPSRLGIVESGVVK